MEELNSYICCTFVYVVVMLFGSCKGVIKLPENMTIPAVYAFGDSIVDQGNNNLLKTLIYCNFLPYGQDFPGGFPSGRFTNGKTPPDLIAKELGIKELIPAYSDKNLTVKDLPTGVSFASGGCGYDPQTSKIVSVTSLSEQLEHFKEYIGKLKGAVGEEGTNKILKEGLFLLVAGSDDLANTYFTVGIRRMQYDISSYADLLVASASDFIQAIYKLGARRIAVFSLPPIGCLPFQRTLAGGSKRDCADNYNKAAQLVNSKLSLQLLDLNNGTLPQSRVVYIDVYNPLLDLILHPQNYDNAAEELGIKELVPAYLDPNLQPQDLLTGVNFASGGSGFDPLTSNVVSVLSLSDQLQRFKEYIAKLEHMIGEQKTSTLLNEALFTIVSGSNDMTNTYFGTVPLRRSQYDVSAYTDLLVSYASAFVQDVYKLGGRRMGVFGLAPLGCLPSQRSLKGGVERKCVDLYNQVAEMFNHKLSVELSSLSARYPDATLIYIDIYHLPLDLVRYPLKYGFQVSDKGCCGTGTIEVAFLCKYTCENASEYVFWDSFHLTENAYRLLVHDILTTSISNFVS
ncbi:hypothetical protein SASPL_103597 [Salvia splendens]|uniref:Zeta-carotene desaturase n=1 Tax=Salvia splendens TaxID=180675 RepID=A0A8X8YIC6_SALSN|nr:hypothetical protein SASPL_103597 [Salvia splendens]